MSALSLARAALLLLLVAEAAAATIEPRLGTWTTIDSATDNVVGTAVDREGNLWLTGTTLAEDFPVTEDALSPTFGGIEDVYVVKVDARGEVAYSTYLGGAGKDAAGDLAVDGQGNVYIAGVTSSADFPVTEDAFQAAPASTPDAFLAKLDPDGRLLYATYFGGSGIEGLGRGRGSPELGVAVDRAGSVFLGGTTDSGDLPVMDAVQPRRGGFRDAFLARFDADLRLVFSTYFGGPSFDQAYRVRTDAAGNAYLLGITIADFPVTPGAFQTSSESNPNFVVRFGPAGDLIYSTLLGPTRGFDGTPSTILSNLAVDADGNAWVVGATQSESFPTTPGAFQPALRGGSDLFVSKLDPTGSSLVYSTYFGGSAAEQRLGAGALPIALDNGGNVYFGGLSLSADLPLTGSLGGESDDFVAKLVASGAELVYSTTLPAAPLALAAGGDSLCVGGAGGESQIDALKIVDRCAGDCDGDGSIGVSEIVAGIGIARRELSLAVCPTFDANGEGEVTIDELVGAVDVALSGCTP